MVTKITAGALSGLVFGVIGEGLVFSIGMMILKIRGVSIVMSGANMTELLVGAVVGTALWGVIGVAVGAVFPNQVGRGHIPTRVGLRRGEPGLWLSAQDRTVSAGARVGRDDGANRAQTPPR